ncbi:MAG: putative ap-1 complex subunit, partial [Streblomastix strix]
STITIKEVNTMQQILRDPDIMRQPAQRLKTFTRILFYISQGIDMSGLFSDMVLNAATKDLVEKKLIYQYLVLYAPTNVDLALLCINTFRSDFQSDNPQIRGHSLRYLSGLRVHSLLEYIVPCVTKGLVDGNSYVRSVAVTGTLKIFWFSPETFENQHYFDSLFEMIRDLDPVVSGNCISVINEILESLAPIVRSLSSQSQTQSNSIFSSIITKPLIVYLLKRFSKYSVWHQTQVLKLVRRFKTEVVQDKYDIMDLLEQCFRSLNSGVVFSAAEVFLSFSQNDANLRKDVRKRLVKPLITIISVSQSPEIQLIAIKNAKQLQEEEIIIEIMKEEQLKKQDSDNNNNEMKQKTKMIQSPSLFSNHFRTFFFHRKDPVYLRIAKLEILSLITDTTNWKYVAEELSEYVFDPNQTVSSLSVFTFKRISIRIPASLPLFSDCMSSVFDYYGEIGYQERMKERDQEQRGERGDESLIGKEESIAQVAIISIRDILRFHPSFFTLFIPLLGKHYYIFDTLQGKAALVNIIGQFGEHIPSAPYLLESFVEQIQNNNDDNSNTFSYFEEEKIESNDGQKDGDDSNDNKEDDEKGQQQQQQQTSSMHSSYCSFSPPQFVLSLLQSLIRLLFLRPLEVQPVIGKLLSSIIQRAPQGVLRDQALLIYRLLLNLGVEGLNQDNKVEGDQEDDLNDNEEGIKYGDDQELKNQKKDLRSLQSLAKNILFTPRELNINQDVGHIHKRKCRKRR